MLLVVHNTYDVLGAEPIYTREVHVTLICAVPCTTCLHACQFLEKYDVWLLE